MRVLLTAVIHILSSYNVASLHDNADSLLYASEAADSRVSSSNYASSNYSTLGRPVSLPISKQQRLLSSSDPDLASSNPASPDNDLSTYSGQFKLAVSSDCSALFSVCQSHVPMTPCVLYFLFMFVGAVVIYRVQP